MGIPTPEEYRIDLNEKVIDQLTVIGEVDYSQAFNGSKEWYCKCECGREVIRTTKVLVKKTDVSKPKSCGMCHKCQPISTKFEDKHLEIIGTEDGRTYYDRGEEIKYIVKCHNCGAISILNYRDFRNKTFCSNCSHDDRWSKVRETNTKHGNAKGGIRTKLLNHFTNMHNKCIKDNIDICEEWAKDNFINFSNWSIANGYIDNISMSLIRIDVDEGYNPDNCRWVNDQTQATNKTNIVLYGNKNLTDWTRERSINVSSIIRSIKKFNPIELLTWLNNLPYRVYYDNDNVPYILDIATNIRENYIMIDDLDTYM